MGFFEKAKSKVRSFFDSQPIQKTRTFLNNAAEVARKTHNVVTHVRKGVERNEMFSPAVKQKSREFGQLSDLGFKKVTDYHTGVDNFLGHLEKTPGYAAS